jgi:putative nucleotidyltransferase with HDIG domain
LLSTFSALARTLTRSLRLFVIAVVSAAFVLTALAAWTYPLRLTVAGHFGFEGLVFWICLTLAASLFPVHIPRGPVVSTFIAPLLASSILFGPFGAALVALLGTWDSRELRGQVPWWGTLTNHASTAISAVVAAWVYWLLIPDGIAVDATQLRYGSLAAALVAGLTYFLIEALITSLGIAVSQQRRLPNVFLASLKSYGLTLVGLVPMSWLMVLAFLNVHYVVGFVFAIPLSTTRAAYQSVVEIRKMFTQTIKALASAIDARDPSTKKHSENVSTIAMEIGEEMGVSEADLESLQWGGLLHDVGKIGIPDAVLLKPSRLNKEERMAMNAHPEKGRDILQDVEALAPILPVILHHHQWYNGSGYPKVQVGDTERALIGEEIPLLARILHVADAFEAMTAVRPYRPNPMGPQQAIEELRKYAGIQFDPKVVEAFAKTATAQGEWPKPEPEAVIPGTTIPMLGQVAKLRSAGTTTPTAEPS